MSKCSMIDLSCPAEPSLHYVSPAHGGWGVVRIAALVPESHQLFVCPFACGRHGALGGEQNGIKDRISYLFITEADIVSGDFEKLIIDSVDELFEALPKIPKVLFIFTSCLDDLLGTDHEAILAELDKKFPHVKFRHCTMNPISLDTSYPPGVTIEMNMYGLLEKSSVKRKQVNILGSNVSFDAECDLKTLLREKGWSVSHISDHDSFESFQTMSEARLNIVTAPIALKAAQQMERELGIPYIASYVNHTPEAVESFYEDLSEFIEEDLASPSKGYRLKAEEKLAWARSVIGDHPIAIDFQAVIKPFSLALTLSEHGFNVGMIASDGIPSHERAAFDVLAKKYPDILVEDPLAHEAVTFPFEGEQYLCIGFDCGYMTGSDKVVNIMEDEGLYGYSGICRLMDMLVEAYTGKADVQEMIKEAGLII